MTKPPSPTNTSGATLPGSAEWLSTHLTGLGFGCKHLQKYSIRKEQSELAFPSRLGFFYSAAENNARISFLDTKKLCSNCLALVVPDGYNCWLTRMCSSTGQKNDDHPQLRLDAPPSSDNFPMLFQAGTEGLFDLHGVPRATAKLGLQTTSPVLIPMPQLPGLKEAWDWIQRQRKPFYIDQLHLTKGWSGLAQRAAERDCIIAQKHGLPYTPAIQATCPKPTPDASNRAGKARSGRFKRGSNKVPSLSPKGIVDQDIASHEDLSQYSKSTTKATEDGQSTADKDTEQDIRKPISIKNWCRHGPIHFDNPIATPKLSDFRRRAQVADEDTRSVAHLPLRHMRGKATKIDESRPLAGPGSATVTVGSEAFLALRKEKKGATPVASAKFIESTLKASPVETTRQPEKERSEKNNIYEKTMEPVEKEPMQGALKNGRSICIKVKTINPNLHKASEDPEGNGGESWGQEGQWGYGGPHHKQRYYAYESEDSDGPTIFEMRGTLGTDGNDSKEVHDQVLDVQIQSDQDPGAQDPEDQTRKDEDLVNQHPETAGDQDSDSGGEGSASHCDGLDSDQESVNQEGTSDSVTENNDFEQGDLFHDQDKSDNDDDYPSQHPDNSSSHSPFGDDSDNEDDLTGYYWEDGDNQNHKKDSDNKYGLTGYHYEDGNNQNHKEDSDNEDGLTEYHYDEDGDNQSHKEDSNNEDGLTEYHCEEEGDNQSHQEDSDNKDGLTGYYYEEEGDNQSHQEDSDNEDGLTEYHCEEEGDNQSHKEDNNNEDGLTEYHCEEEGDNQSYKEDSDNKDSLTEYHYDEDGNNQSHKEDSNNENGLTGYHCEDVYNQSQKEDSDNKDGLTGYYYEDGNNQSHKEDSDNEGEDSEEDSEDDEDGNEEDEERQDEWYKSDKEYYEYEGSIFEEYM